MKRRLYKNYLYNTIYQVVILILPLILTPFVTRVIGAEGIGQYSYTRSVVAYFTLIGTMGSNMYAQREIAYVIENKEKRSRIFWQVFFVRNAMLLVSLGVYGIVGVGLGRYQLLFAIQIIDILATGVDITWFFQGLEEFDKIVIRNLLVKIVSAGLILILVRNSSDLWKYVFIYAFGNLLGQLWLWKDVRDKITVPQKEDWYAWKHCSGMFRLFIPQVATQIYLVLDKTMIELITNDSAETGYYELAQTIQRTGLTLVTAFGTVASTRVASLYAEGMTGEIKQVLAKSCEIVCFLGMPIALGLMAVSSNLIPWFMGEEYGSVIQLLVLLCPLILIIGMSNISGIQYMVPVGLQKKMTISTLCGVAFNAVANAVLIPIYGTVGAAVASVVAEVAVLIIQFWCIREVLLMRRLCISMCQAFLSAMVMFAAVEWAESNWFGAPGVAHTIALVIIGVVVYGILFGLIMWMKKLMMISSLGEDK